MEKLNSIVLAITVGIVAYLFVEVQDLKETDSFFTESQPVVTSCGEKPDMVVRDVFAEFKDLVIELKKLEDETLPDVKLEDK